MRVRILTTLRGALGAFNAGQETELSDAVGAAWVAAGVAVALDAPAPVESAVLEPVEAAMLPQPRGRRR